METSVGEKIFATLLILITFGSVAILTYSLVATEPLSLPSQPVLTRHRS